MSFSASGTPASGEPSGSPAAPAASTAAACGERALGVDVQERVHRAVDRGDPVEVGPGDLDRAGLTGGSPRQRERSSGQVVTASCWSSAAALLTRLF